MSQSETTANSLSVFLYFIAAFLGAVFLGNVIYWHILIFSGVSESSYWQLGNLLAGPVFFASVGVQHALFALPAFAFGYILTLILYRKGIKALRWWLLCGVLTGLTASLWFAFFDAPLALFSLGPATISGGLGGYFLWLTLVRKGRAKADGPDSP